MPFFSNSEAPHSASTSNNRAGGAEIAPTCAGFGGYSRGANYYPNGGGGGSFTGGLHGCCDDSPDMMSFVGAGRGEFIQETAYKYVGSGAGEFDVVRRDYTCAVGICCCCLSVLMLLMLGHLLPFGSTEVSMPVDCNAPVTEQVLWTPEQQAHCCATTWGGCVQAQATPTMQPAGMSAAAPSAGATVAPPMGAPLSAATGQPSQLPTEALPSQLPPQPPVLPATTSFRSVLSKAQAEQSMASAVPSIPSQSEAA